MSLFACTGTGLATFVTDKSAELPTKTLAEAVLLAQVGSLAVQETESVWVMVDPEAALLFTTTANVKFADVLAARLAIVQVRFPRVHVHPAGPVRDCAVVFAGVVSVNVMVVAVAGPLLVTVWL
jgi:hypothetical protein